MDRKGFSLIELLIAMTVGLIVLGAIYAAVIASQRSTVQLEKKVTSHQDVRGAIEVMALEIRMASYNPNCKSGMWLDTSCNTSLSQSSKGIQQATPTAITVEMDINGSEVIGDDSNEMITYNYDSANQYLTRASRCQSPVPFLGNSLASGLPRTVRLANAADQPVFKYYDGNGNIIANPEANIPNIRRVEITLIVETDEIMPDTGQRRRTVYTTSVIPRNHAISAF